jgi:hypothetical protein
MRALDFRLFHSMEDKMRKFALAAAAATALTGGILATGFATAATPGTSHGIRAATEALNDIDDVQYRHRGRRHCWYAGGWNGPGWYWCGYGSRRNRGWGGPDGWNNWRRR